ncbi:hypothetical protein BJY52DRAFT_1228423 [Lactarius psammicola]|nr:hypothetical protein BJY52DRAFT_1228423 [Lactarius psammicola]
MDALDECPRMRGFHRRVKRVLELVKGLVDLHHPNLRLCITSRPEFDLRTTLVPLATQQISLYDESGQKQDISGYVTFVVRSDRRMKRWRDDDKDAVSMGFLPTGGPAALFSDQSPSYPRELPKSHDLELVGTYYRDATLLSHYPPGRSIKGLARLTCKWLRRAMQDCGPGGHDSEEDACTCVGLLKAQIKNGETAHARAQMIVDYCNPSTLHGVSQRRRGLPPNTENKQKVKTRPARRGEEHASLPLHVALLPFSGTGTGIRAEVEYLSNPNQRHGKQSSFGAATGTGGSASSAVPHGLSKSFEVKLVTHDEALMTSQELLISNEKEKGRNQCHGGVSKIGDPYDLVHEWEEGAKRSDVVKGGPRILPLESVLGMRVQRCLKLTRHSSHHWQATGRVVLPRTGDASGEGVLTVIQTEDETTTAVEFRSRWSTGVQKDAPALKAYKQQTKRDLASHPLATRLQSCDSPRAIIAMLRAQFQTFDRTQIANERWTKWLDPTVNVLYAFSATLGNGVGLVIARYISTLERYLRWDCVLLQRLEQYIEVRPTVAMTDIIVKIMAEVLSILGIVTKEVGQGRTKAYLKKLIGRKDVEDALQRLDALTQEEARMAAAEALTITRGIDDKVKDVNDKVKDVDDKVEGVDERVQAVDIKVDGIYDRVRTVDSKVQRVDHRVGTVIQGVKETGVAIQQVANQVTDLNRNELRKDLRKWITPPDPSVNYNTASDSHHDAGSGKSILSSVIIRDIKSTSDAGSAFLAYFYFDFKDTAKQDSRALLSSLLVQLSDQSDIFCDALFSLYSAHKRGSEQPTVDSLARCLKDMLTMIRQMLSTSVPMIREFHRRVKGSSS